MPSDVTRAKAKEREAMKQQQRPLPAILGIAFLLNAFKWTVFLCCLGFVIWGWWESSECFLLRVNYLIELFKWFTCDIACFDLV